jgi:hypothetical protein
MTHFIKSRKHALTGMINGYTRLTLTRRVDPKIRELVLQRWSEEGVSCFGLQLLETAQQKLARKPCLPGSNIVHVNCHWRNSIRAGENVPGLQEFLDGSVDNIVLEEHAAIKIMSKGVSCNGRKWYAGDYGLFEKADGSMWLGRVRHFLYVPQPNSYFVLAMVDTFVCQGKAKLYEAGPVLNFVYVVKLKCISTYYVRMEDFSTMVVVAPHWFDATLACAIAVDPDHDQLT